MQTQRNRLIPVETEVEREEPAAPSAVEKSTTWMLLTALRALSERALIALAAIEHLILMGSVFAIWLTIIKNPTELQLVGVGGYAVAVLLVIFMRGRQSSR